MYPNAQTQLEKEIVESLNFKGKNYMKRDIILAGVGGQGILSIATVIGDAALNEGLYLKQAEVHGMSQRGGDVQSNLRLSSTPIYSDLIPKAGADIIVIGNALEKSTERLQEFAEAIHNGNSYS
jgi:Pyruvate/2-oxoacid:ferredoxin oxidoreductase gamma subunit